MVSKALLKAAGVELQHDYNSTLKGRQIKFPEVVVTGGYNLSAKKIFHGVLPRYKSESSMQQFEYFIKNCLNTAVNLNMRSIAFPALGTGNLIYPSNLVASSMFLVADKFISANNIGSLTEINFVIYPADTGVLQVFEAVEKNRKKTVGNMFVDSVVACPDFTTCTVQVIGPSDELIHDTFKQIEESFNTNGITDEGIQTNRLAKLKASDKQDSKYPKGDIQYLQYLLNATEDINSDSFDINMAYNSSNNFSKPDTLCVNDKKLQIPQLTPMGSSILYRPKQDAIVMITKEGVKVYVYKADICYLSKVDCIVNPFIRRMNETDGLTNIVARAGEQMQNECTQYIVRHGICEQRLCITTAGSFTHYKKILHVKSPARNDNSTIAALTENITKTIRICLSRANMNNFASIAFSPFPTLGFDTACHTDIVKTYPESVMKYSNEAGMKSSIKEIHFVHTDQAEMEAIHSAFLQTIPDSYVDEYIKQKDTSNKLLGYAEMNEFHTLKTSTKPVTFLASKNISDRTEKVKMYQPIPGSFSGDIQYQQRLMNATDDLNVGSFYKRKSMAYGLNPLSTSGTSHINNHKIEPCQSWLRSSTLYRPKQDSVIMITKEGVKVFVYKADICYLSKVDCIVNPSSSKLNETVGLTNIFLEAGEKLKTECSQYIRDHGVLHDKCVCITTAGNLNHYKKILHVKAPVWNEYLTVDAISEKVSAAITICLSQANMDSMTSIALPPLITLGFDTVLNTSIVKAYPESVMKYSTAAGLRSSIKEIHFVHTDQSEVEAIHSAFLQTIPDSYADDCIKRKDRTSETLGYADRNEFHTFTTNTETSKLPVSDTISDKTSKFKMYQSMPDLFSDSSENVPSNWTDMDANEMITTVILQPYDQEYKDVVAEFKQTSERHYDIIKVERIQNRTLHQQYNARKKLMDSINPSCFNNERKLWHGTTLEAVNGINTYGFNRGYCGKNAASYGNGVYFAVNSSYSTKSQYSTPDHDNSKRVYLCKVLVGEYVKGQQDMRVPPPKYGASGSHILYDSVVDKPSSPRIFVIFHDAQAYPEYLVVFR
ncbi:poly [ADP-ribose] polymerase 10/14/15 [Mytilus galloprovincialis]|uniref:Poly [ADP-ribose] polymerase n=2 Tax=Mytilus galloprovincialis TaxID=29158 RepID=A0A8B6DBD5_MYTGA|nr:poly [ADP-ribose] polymerase 10/14/15 [Mytilus galloprovincialis]